VTRPMAAPPCMQSECNGPGHNSLESSELNMVDVGTDDCIPETQYTDHDDAARPGPAVLPSVPQAEPAPAVSHQVYTWCSKGLNG
jgi:hypothetical protein